MEKKFKSKCSNFNYWNLILSGRTKDKNTSFISEWLNNKCGINVEEVRIIPDKQKNYF